MEKKYKKIPKLLRFFSFVILLWGLLGVFFFWFKIFIFEFPKRIINSSIYSEYVPLLLLLTWVLLVSFIILIIILHYTAKLRANDQLENNPRIVSKNPVKRFFGWLLLSFVWLLAIYFLTIYRQSVALPNIPEDYFEISWYDTSLQEENNAFFLIKDLFAKNQSMSWLWYAISQRDIGSSSDFMTLDTGQNIISEITGQEYHDKIQKLVQWMEYGLNVIWQQKIDAFVDDLSGLLLNYVFQYPIEHTSIETAMHYLQQYQYDRQIPLLLWLHYCQKSDYDRCVKYLGVHYRFWNALLSSPWTLVTALIGDVYSYSTLDMFSFIIDKYSLSEQYLQEIKTFISTPYDVQSLYKNIMLHERLADLGTIDGIANDPSLLWGFFRLIFLDEDQTRQMINDYFYKVIEDSSYEYNPTAYLPDFYKKYIYHYLDITWIKNPLWIMAWQAFAPRGSTIKQRLENMENIRKSALGKVDAELYEAQLNPTVDSWATSTFTWSENLSWN